MLARMCPTFELKCVFIEKEGVPFVCVYFQVTKTSRGSKEGKCHAKTMMITKVNERPKYPLSMFLSDDFITAE